MANVIVSACLLGHNCKYNGSNNDARDHIASLIEGHTIIAVCPEMLGGLSCPRIPCEIQGDRVIGMDGKDYTEAYTRGARKALEMALEGDVAFAIVKSKSPSCAKHQVYDGTFTHTLIEGSGIFTKALLKHGIKVFESV